MDTNKYENTTMTDQIAIVVVQGIGRRAARQLKSRSHASTTRCFAVCTLELARGAAAAHGTPKAGVLITTLRDVEGVGSRAAAQRALSASERVEDPRLVR